MRDSDVRKAVLQLLRERHAGDSDTRIIQEMGVWSGSVRIDIAVVNGELCGFELKSDRDTLQRLPLQAELYSRVFDRLYLVVGDRHAIKAHQHIRDWWGVITASDVDGRIFLQDRREAETNPCPDPYLIAQLLWKDEAISVLEAHGLARGWRGKRVKDIHAHLGQRLPLEELKKAVRAVLKARNVASRQVQTSQFQVSIHADADPMF